MSGNPKGRRKTKPLTNALLKLLDEKVPKNATGILEPLRGKKWAEVMAHGLVASAANGEPAAFREAADRVEGKVKDKLEVSGSEEFSEAVALAFERARGRK